jgi:hypothetical protein
MASHPLIEAHLGTLRRRLPADAVDELADGLIETYHHHLAQDADPHTAARRAVNDFGEPDTIIAAFTRQAPGRRMALLLLATGPLVGPCWGATLLLGHAWTWPVPAPLRIGLGLGLLLTVATLATAATSRHSYRRTRVAAIGGIGLITLDTAMITAAVLTAPALVWPMAAAIPASLLRIGTTVRAMPAILSR